LNWLKARDAAIDLAIHLVLLASSEGTNSKSKGPRQDDTAQITCSLRVCLNPSKFQKFYKIFRHIESLDAYMEH
jgi:hypothetical protein